jgi:aspartate/methionine/tyrosine aminotransferase
VLGVTLSARVRDLQPVAARPAMEMIAERRAAGGEVFPLYGSPHWLPPEHVLAAAEEAVRDESGAPAEGLAALREAVAAKLGRVNRIEATADQVLVTNAANHGLYVLFTALLDPGDEVVMHSPHYYYEGIVALAGGRCAYAAGSQAHSWAWDHEALRAAIGPRTKVLVVNTPTNPTGYVATQDDLEAIAELAAEHDLLVVSDEAYDHLVYDGSRHLSFGSVPGVTKRTFTVLSCTKSYAMRHWRVGFLVAPARLVRKLRDVLEWNVFQVNHVAQHAALAAIEGPQDWIADIGARFQRCRDVMVAQLAEAETLSYAHPRGGPFIFLNVENVGIAAAAFHAELIARGVATDPGGPFGSDTHLRLPFGGELADVEEAGRRVAAAARAASSAAASH